MKTKIINDKEYQKTLNNIVYKTYQNIFDLPTKDLVHHYIQVYKELLSRKDYSNIEDVKIIYEISKQKLIEEGTYNV